MPKKNRVPAIIFNSTSHKYPKGLRVTDEDELDIKLKSGEWNTGPVDESKKPKKEKPLSKMTALELVQVAVDKGIEVDENWTEKELLKAIKAHKG